MGDRSAGRLSHYDLLEKIGQGGMGTVFKALDTRLGRPVAVKVLHGPEAAAADRRRQFQQEARTAAALNHPNVCTIHEVGEAGPGDRPVLAGERLDITAGTPFIVMELLEGETLRDRLDRLGALPLHEVVDLAVQLAEGLRAAHARRIVHRDLKPQNVVRGEAGQWKILDFGLAQPVREAAADPEEQSTVSVSVPPAGRIAGTVAYMSPEQARAGDVGRASDLFSFGIVLYEVTAGRKPFQADTGTGTLAKILESEPDRLSLVRPEVPVELERVVARCLRKEPAERFQDAGELAAELQRLRDTVLAGSWVRATPTPEVSPDVVAVLPFTVRGDESLAYLSEGMVDLIGTKLDGAGDLRSVDAHRILCCLPAPAGAADPAAGAEAARGLGAGLFVLGNVLEAAGSLSLRAVLYDATGGVEEVSRASVQGPLAEIFRLVDQLTSSLLATRSASPNQRLTRIAAATTGSFDALKAYLEGEREMRAMRRDAAVEAYRRAVDLDPRFALAWYRLSVASLWSHRPEAAWEAARTALDHASRLIERDRLLLQAFHALLRGANGESERLYRTIVGTYPDDVEAWFQLGELLFHHGPQRGRTICDSREVWQRLLALDPGHLSGLVHLCAVAAGRGDRELLDATSRRVEELGGGESVLWVRALRACALDDLEGAARALEELRAADDLSVAWATRFLGVFLGRTAEARPVATLLTAEIRSAEAQALGHAYLAHLEAAGGRWRAAAASLDRARGRNRPYALEYRALLAAAPMAPLGPRQLEALRSEVVAWDAGSEPATAAPSLWLTPHEGLHVPLREYLAGLLGVRLGDADAAVQSARRLEAWRGEETAGTVARGMADSLRAHAAWSAGRRKEALTLIERSTMAICFYFTLWSPFLAQDHERFTHAEWLRESGRPEEALPWYSTFGENSVFDRIHVAPSHLRRGQIYERLGRREKARRHYRAFLELWSDCDAGLRSHVDQARSRLAALG